MLAHTSGGGGLCLLGPEAPREKNLEQRTVYEAYMVSELVHEKYHL